MVLQQFLNMTIQVYRKEQRNSRKDGLNAQKEKSSSDKPNMKTNEK